MEWTQVKDNLKKAANYTSEKKAQMDNMIQDIHGKAKDKLEGIIIPKKALLCVVDTNLDKNKIQTDKSKKAATIDALHKAYRSNEEGAAGYTANKNGFKMFEVQFNPTQLSFSESDSGINDKQGSGFMKTRMNLTLIYDDTVESDAFIWISGQQKYAHSIKEKMEGLMSLLANDNTRMLIFCWGTMFYAGELESATMKYTMFNPKGYPIRGEISLAMTLYQSSTGKSSEKYWNKAIDKVFM